MARDAFTSSAEQLALDPALVRQLLVDHAPDRYGRCRAHHAHGVAHPCSIRTLAELARGFERAPGPVGRTNAAAPAAECRAGLHCCGGTHLPGPVRRDHLRLVR